MAAEIAPENIEDTAKQAPSTAGMTTRVVKGSIWTLAGQVLPLGISLFTTPFVIRLLGAEAYGVVVLVGLIPTYFGFADMGMGLASTKFASEAYAEGDAEKEGRVVRTAAAVAFAASLPVALALLIFSWQITALFNVPEHLHGEASLALKIASVTFVLGFLNNIFNSPQLARLRMDLNILVSTVPRMLGLLATPVVIYFGGGVVGAVSVLCAIAVATLAGNLLVSQNQLGTLFETSFDRKLYRPMLKFGGPIMVSGIAAVMLANLEKGVLPYLTSVKELAYYSVAFTFSSMLSLFSASMSQSLLPAFARLYRLDCLEELNALLTRTYRLNLFLLPILVSGLYLIGPSFFQLWAGSEFRQNSVSPFNILLIGITFHILTYLPYTLLMALGKTTALAKLYIIELPFYCFAVYFLVSSYGASGAAIAWSLRIIVDNILLVLIVGSIENIGADFRKCVKPFALGLAFILVIILLPSDLTLFFSIAVVLIVGVYVAILFRYLLEHEEKHWLSTLVRKKHR